MRPFVVSQTADNHDMPEVQESILGQGKSQMTRRTIPAQIRFWRMVRHDGDCWMWQGAVDPKGYGRFNPNGHTMLAHRFAYESAVGPIPEGLQIDHLCRTPGCVNPAHLEVVTNKENSIRGESLNAINARKVRCDYGHPFDDANTYIRPDNGYRQCLTCKVRTRADFHARTGR